MSDNWQFFPCLVDDRQAFVFFDDGISKKIDDLPLPKALRIALRLSAPNADGLPTNEEFPALSVLEDKLAAEMAALGGIYVGRITVDGQRHFRCFVACEDDEVERSMRRLAEGSTYVLSHSLELDPDKSGYWQELYPTADDRRTIKDIHVLEALAERGDDPDAVRQVDHWAYFKSAAQQAAFRRWLEAEGYDLHAADDEVPGEYPVRFFHRSTVRLAEISGHTVALARKARELGGTYDGWETSVEKPD